MLRCCREPPFDGRTRCASAAQGYGVLNGQFATNGRIEAATDSVAVRMVNHIYYSEISRILAGTNAFETGCSQRQKAPPPHCKLLANRHFNAPLNPPFNDSTRLSGSLSRDHWGDVAFV